MFKLNKHDEAISIIDNIINNFQIHWGIGVPMHIYLLIEISIL